MLYSAVAGLVKSASETCADVDYEDSADPGESGCGDGPIEKRHPPASISYWDRGELESSLGKRISPGDPVGESPMTCTYSTQMCTGPKVISKWVLITLLRDVSDTVA